jgi:hypothetical protein
MASSVVTPFGGQGQADQNRGAGQVSHRLPLSCVVRSFGAGAASRRRGGGCIGTGPYARLKRKGFGREGAAPRGTDRRPAVTPPLPSSAAGGSARPAGSHTARASQHDGHRSSDTSSPNRPRRPCSTASSSRPPALGGVARGLQVPDGRERRDATRDPVPVPHRYPGVAVCRIPATAGGRTRRQSQAHHGLRQPRPELGPRAAGHEGFPAGLAVAEAPLSSSRNRWPQSWRESADSTPADLTGPHWTTTCVRPSRVTEPHWTHM